MSETNNDNTQTPNFPGGAYDFEARQKKEEEKLKKDAKPEPMRGNQSLPKDQSGGPIGEDKDDEQRREQYKEHRNQAKETHDYARSMGRDRDLDEDYKKHPNDPRNEQVPYTNHDSRPEDKPGGEPDR